MLNLKHCSSIKIKSNIKANLIISFALITLYNMAKITIAKIKLDALLISIDNPDVALHLISKDAIKYLDIFKKIHNAFTSAIKTITSIIHKQKAKAI